MARPWKLGGVLDIGVNTDANLGPAIGGRPDEPFTGDEIVCMMAASCVGVGTGEEHPLSVDISCVGDGR